MAEFSEGNLRLLRAVGHGIFFLGIFFLVLSYAFLQETIVLPGWHLVSEHYPQKSSYFYLFLVGLGLLFFFISLLRNRVKRFPDSNQAIMTFLGRNVSSHQLKNQATFMVHGIFLGLSMFFLGMILKVWQINNPDLRGLGIGFSIWLVLSLLVLIGSFLVPFINKTES